MRVWAVLVPVMLSSVLLIANQLAQPPTALKPKIFVIGLSRTGTTSIGNALALLGYKRIGWKDIRSRHLVHTFINGNLEPATDQTKHFDAFEDLPWPYMYQEMAEMYPDAKFILSLRRDETTWLKSMRRYLGRNNWRPAAHFFGAHEVEGNGEIVLAAYRNHTANVRQYFSDKRDRYSELVIEDGDANWKTLCSIAECPGGRVPALDFPKSNTAEDWDNNVLVYLHWFWGFIITRIEDLSTTLYYKQDWPLMKATLQKAWHLISIVELACSNLYFKLAVQNQRPLPVAQGEIPILRGRDD